MTNRRIAFFLGDFQGNGGIGRVTSILANALAKDEKNKIYTIAYCETNEPTLYELDKDIVGFSLFNKYYSMKDAILFKNVVGKLRHILKVNGIDILIACGALFYPVAVAATAFSKCKCVTWEHSNANNFNDHQFQKECRWMGAKYSNASVVLTKQDYQLYKKKYHPINLRQIYNPADERITYCYNLHENHKKIISVGRLCYQKNYPMLVNVAKDVLTSHPDWVWDIYGEGPDREEIEQLIQQSGVGDRLILKGQVNNMYELYADYSFYVLTSRYEGFGMALLEANISGLPIVSFDVECGPREIIENNVNGILVNAQDKMNMIDAVSELCNNRDKCLLMSRESFRSSTKFKIDEIVKQWNQLFDELHS